MQRLDKQTEVKYLDDTTNIKANIIGFDITERVERLRTVGK
jgi:hypothetical protein